MCDNLEFPSGKSSKIFTAHRILWDTNFKQEKSRVCKGRFFEFCKFMSFTAVKKLVLYISLKKTAPTKVKHYQYAKFNGISPKETQENSLSARFAFCAHVDVIKYEKKMTFPLSARRLLELSSSARVRS